MIDTLLYITTFTPVYLL